jgi:3-isopropylmalate dehydrogenase
VVEVTERYRIGRMLGDGIGPEIVPATVRVVDQALDAVGAQPLDWIELPMGASALASHGAPVPNTTKEELATCHGWLAGPHDSESYPASWRSLRERPPGGELRHHFDLFANIRPSRSRQGVAALVQNVDLIIVRENTEGFYADRNMFSGSGEFMPTPDLALVVGVFTRQAIRRVAEVAFAFAQTRRRRVTAVHKSNALPLAFGLFLDVCREVAELHPDVVFESRLVDAMAAQLVRHPQDYDVIVTENMFGDTLSDLAGELVGSLGLAPALNVSGKHAMAQAAHGSAPDIAGQNSANPVGLMLSSGMLLEWLGPRVGDPLLTAAARHLEIGIDETLSRGIKTRDLGGSSGTEEFTDALCSVIARG